jgi:hypothetical protein
MISEEKSHFSTTPAGPRCSNSEKQKDRNDFSWTKIVSRICVMMSKALKKSFVQISRRNKRWMRKGNESFALNKKVSNAAFTSLQLSNLCFDALFFLK